MLFGIGIIGINFILSIINYYDSGNLFNVLNMMNSAKAGMLFERLNVVNLMGNAIECQHIIFAFHFAIIGATVLISVLKFNYTVSISIVSKQTGFICRVKRIFNRGEYRSKSRIYSMSLISSELYKSLISSKAIYAFIVLAAVKIGISSIYNQYNATYDDAVYKEYMTLLSGEWTEDKSDYINAEFTRMNTALESQESMYNKYKNGNISEEAYLEYIEELNYSLSRKSLFETRIQRHDEYIKKLSDEGKEAYFIYDTGWKKLLFPAFDWTLFGALLLFSGLFVREYNRHSSSNAFADILRLTKKGRIKIMRAKLIVSAGVSAVMAVLWNLADIVIIYVRYELPCPNAPIYSIREFANTDLNLELWQYILFMLILRVLIWVALSMFICTLSALLENSITLITAITAVVLLPGLLSELSLDLMNLLDFISFSKVTDMYLQGQTVLIIYAAAFAIISFLSFYTAKKKWC